MKLKVLSWILLIAFISLFPVVAQDNKSPVIDASNIHQLQSVAQINYADLPETAGVIDKGLFAVDADAEYYATVNRQNQIVFWQADGSFIKLSAAEGCQDTLPGAFIDGVFYDPLTYSGSEFFAAVYGSTTSGIVAYHMLQSDTVTTVCDLLPGLVPQRIWTSETAEAWVEGIYQNSGWPTVDYFPISVLTSSEETGTVKNQPKTPDNDLDSLFRIGRIDPPFALTVTKSALLKRWNLETGEVTATAQLISLPAAGQVNADGASFTWVDQKFESLHLLNFASSEDQVIASLGGTYIPFLLLTAKADVIIGVDVGNEPNVVAWDVASGERLNLGDYRTCNRQPDMVRLSKDGSSLVVGCDTGLDIWRVSVSS